MAKWDADPALKEKLELAGWRYAQLIGIVSIDKELARTLALGEESSASTVEIVSHKEGDLKEYAHFIRTHSENGKTSPVWDEKQASIFVAEVAGTDKRTASAWLRYDWP